MKQLDLPVEEFTTPDPITASEDSSIDDLNHLMKEHGVRHIPITSGDSVVGVVSDRDVRLVSGLDVREKSMIRARDIMAENPVTVNAQATLDEVAFEMSQKKIGSVIVNDGNKLLGIFTVTDALNALIEITRSMRDERA